MSTEPDAPIRICHLCGEPTRRHCEICEKPTCVDCLNHSDGPSGEVTFCNACTSPDPIFRKGKPPIAVASPPKPKDKPLDDLLREVHIHGTKPPQRPRASWNEWGNPPGQWTTPDAAAIKRLVENARVLDNDFLRLVCRSPIEASVVISLIQAEYRRAFGLEAQIVLIDPNEGTPKP